MNWANNLESIQLCCKSREEDITKCLDLASIVAARTTFGGTGNSAVKEQLDQAKEALAADEADAASLA